MPTVPWIIPVTPAATPGSFSLVDSRPAVRKKAPISLSCSAPALNSLTSIRRLRAGLPPLLLISSSKAISASVALKAARFYLDQIVPEARGLAAAAMADAAILYSIEAEAFAR